LGLKIKNRLRAYIAYHDAKYSVLIMSFTGCRKPRASTSPKWVRLARVSTMPRK
jgi:hypothetical protein